MSTIDPIQNVLRDSNYHLDLFEESELNALEDQVGGGTRTLAFTVQSAGKQSN